ncbi:MAG: DUF4339 domain-containing protein [Bdellovibrionota bacterium]
MQRVWYLLRNRRYEGPFELEDLNVRAQQGQLSPDDYVVEGKNFDKGQTVYQRAAEILPRDAFSLSLSVPELTEAKLPPLAAESSAVEGRRDSHSSTHESVRPLGASSSRNFEESVSPLRDLISRVSFANLVIPCLVVLSAVWFFDRQSSSAAVERQPANEAPEVAGKKQVTREFVRHDASEETAAPIEKLRPSERPSERPSGVASRDAPAAVQQKLNERLSDRGLASEGAPVPERIDPQNGESNGAAVERGPNSIVSEDPPPPFENEAFSDDQPMEPAPVDSPEGEAY